MSLELRFCTIISNDGITIFHRTFVEDELDEYLFSGFSSAMIAFSRELGDALSLIKMEKQTIFYHESEEDGFLVMSVTNGFDLEEVQQKIKALHERESLDLLLAGSSLGIVQNENDKFERDLFEIFNIPPSLANEQVSNFDLRMDDNYAPPESSISIPKANRETKSLEEQLQEEAESLERFLQDEDDGDPRSNKSKDEETLNKYMNALESLDF